MNRYMFGGIISRRTFTMFVSAMVFFAILLGIGLGISAFAEEEEEEVYSYLEITAVPQRLYKVFDPNYVLTGNDFDGLTYNLVFPVGCEQNPNGPQDIVDTITVDGDTVSNARVEKRDGDRVEISAAHQSGTEIIEMNFNLITNSPNVCDVNASIGVYFSEYPKYDTTYISTSEGYETVKDDNFYYFVGENDVYTVYYFGEGGDVVVPSEVENKPVTKILYHTFAEKDTIKSITIPEGVDTIESEAIIYLEGVEEINIPSTAVNFEVDSITELYYDDLKEINVADGNTKVFNQNGDGALYYSNGDGTKQILAYPGASEGTSFTVGDDITKIAPNAFGGAANLTTVNMPSDADSVLTTIGSSAFSGSGVTAIDLPSTVTEIGSSAFSNCKNLSTLDIGSAKAVPGYMCYYYSENEADISPLTTFTVPETVTSIDSGAFDGLALTDITIPYSVNSIFGYSINGTAENPVKIHGSTGTAAEEYCRKYGDICHVQFVNDIEDDFVSIPFEAVSGNGTWKEFTVSIIDGENRKDIAVSPNGNKNIVVCDKIEEGKTIDIVISKKGYVDYTINDFTVGEDTIPEDIKMYAGDVNDDNTVNIDDINALITRNMMIIDKYDYPENYNNYQHYDFDESGCINIYDIATAIESFRTLYNAE